MAEETITIEYQMRPGPGEWVSFGDLMAQLATWAVIPSAGPPAVTVSKRVTVTGPEDPSCGWCLHAPHPGSCPHFAGTAGACSCTAHQPDTAPEHGGVDPMAAGSMIAALYPGVLNDLTARWSGPLAKTEQDVDTIVAYRSGYRPGILLCREHGGAGAGWIPLTSEDLPDGGVCTWIIPFRGGETCGRDVLATPEHAYDNSPASVGRCLACEHGGHDSKDVQ